MNETEELMGERKVWVGAIESGCGSERWIRVRDEWVLENIDLRN